MATTYKLNEKKVREYVEFWGRQVTVDGRARDLKDAFPVLRREMRKGPISGAAIKRILASKEAMPNKGKSALKGYTSRDYADDLFKEELLEHKYIISVVSPIRRSSTTKMLPKGNKWRPRGRR